MYSGCVPFLRSALVTALALFSGLLLIQLTLVDLPQLSITTMSCGPDPQNPSLMKCKAMHPPLPIASILATTLSIGLTAWLAKRELNRY